MNKSDNRHMNVFQAYNQSGLLPIENNISRGLAILLQDKPELLILFLSLIEKKSRDNNSPIKIDYPTGEYTVDFQKTSESFETYSTVIGVALTADEIEEISVDASAGERKYITDISIFYDDTLIIIEVKRTGENCAYQLNEQLDSYISSHDPENNEFRRGVVSLTWTDIVKMITRSKAMSDSKPDRLLDDYLEHLSLNFPGWLPVEKLGNIKFYDPDRIVQRLNKVKELYVAKYCSDRTLIGVQRSAIPIDSDFVSECNLHFNEITKNIELQIHPSDTGRQFWNLRSKYNADFFKKHENEITVSDPINNFSKSIKVTVSPYIKFSHFSKGLMWLTFKERDFNDVEKLFEFAASITGRKKRDKWTDFWGKVDSQSDFFIEDSLSRAKENFKDIFEETKSYADISLGFDVYGHIPLEDAKKLDKDDDNRFIDFIKAYLDTLISEKLAK